MVAPHVLQGLGVLGPEVNWCHGSTWDQVDSSCSCAEHVKAAVMIRTLSYGIVSAGLMMS